MSVNRKSQSSQERRFSDRQGIDQDVRFCIVSGENGRKSREIPGSIKNLSEEGFCLTADLTIVDDLHILTGSSGTSENTLEIRIQFPEEPQILILGTACWYNLSKPHAFHKYHVGVRIESASENYLALLRKYLRHNRRWKFRKSLRNIKWLERFLNPPKKP